MVTLRETRFISSCFGEELHDIEWLISHFAYCVHTRHSYHSRVAAEIITTRSGKGKKKKRDCSMSLVRLRLHNTHTRTTWKQWFSLSWLLADQTTNKWKKKIWNSSTWCEIEIAFGFGWYEVYTRMARMLARYRPRCVSGHRMEYFVRVHCAMCGVWGVGIRFGPYMWCGDRWTVSLHMTRAMQSKDCEWVLCCGFHFVISNFVSPELSSIVQTAKTVCSNSGSELWFYPFVAVTIFNAAFGRKRQKIIDASA